MKKFLLAGLMVVLLTGCGETEKTENPKTETENPKTEKVECTYEQNISGVEMNTFVDVILKDGQFHSLDMELEAILTENLLSQKEVFVNSIVSEYEGFEEEYGVKPQVNETDKGVEVELNMSAEQAAEFYGFTNLKASKSEFVKEFESQGFTCK